jgi:hypothetical protein
MAVDFPTDGRWRSTKLDGKLPDRARRGQAARNFFAFRQGQRPPEPPPMGRDESSIRGHHPMNGSGMFAERATNLA